MTQRKKKSTSRSASGGAKKKAPASSPRPAAQKAATPKAATQKAEAVKPAAEPAAPLPKIDADERRRMVEEAAYYLAEGRTEANPARDWSEAEAQIDAQLAQEGRV